MNAARRRIAGLLALAAGHMAVLGWAWSGLPDTVAVRFGRYGRPTNWADRLEFATVVVLLALGTVLLPVLIQWAIRRVPAKLISVPRHDYWFHPERAAAARDLLGQWILGIGWLTGGFSLGVTWLIARANLSDPVRFPNLFFLFFAAYGIILLVAISVLVFRLRRGST